MRCGCSAVGVLVGLCLFASCTKPNPALCCTSADDCAAVGLHQDSKPCASGLACISNTCVLAPDGGAGCASSDQCSGTSPFCDPGTHECRACAADSECASSVCDLEAGSCIAASAVLYASPSGGDAASCAVDDPCSLNQAVSLLDSNRQAIKLSSGTYLGNPIFTTSALLDGTNATLSAGSGFAGIEAADNAHLRIIGLKVQNDAGPGIACDQRQSSTAVPMLDLVDVVVDSDNTALFADPCAVYVTRSHFHVSTSSAIAVGIVSASSATSTAIIDRTEIDGGDGIVSGGANVQVTNSVIANQTGPDGALSGAAFGASGRLKVSFSTIINSVISSADGVPKCDLGAAAGACIDNSVVLNLAPGAPTNTITGTASVLSYSIVFPQSAAVSGSNNMLGLNAELKDPANGDYHLKTGSPAIDAADPGAVNSSDYEGTARPQGARDDMGAFEFH